MAGRLYETVGDLLRARGLDVILHACNGQGVWGSGFAAALRRAEPSAYGAYTSHCAAEGRGASLRGTCPTFPGERGLVACAITSLGYGERRDPPRMILDSTASALRDLESRLLVAGGREEIIRLGSPRINSGLFATPWEETRKVIETFLSETPLRVEWIVFELL